ncbi:MAG: DNA repair protein RadC [Cyclobacteriaceae bacterium]|nr:DNA repair protein RadC [Cyclobacteriaceae bacterium]
MDVHENRPTTIRSWSPEDRPREKMLLKGTTALSDAELVAILLGTGTSTVSAVELARRVLAAAGHDLNQLARLTIKDLTKVRGIGEAKAVTIVAALELGRRRRQSESSEKIRITSSRDSFEQIRGQLMDLTHEEFWVLLLNRANRLIKVRRISEGGVAGTVADPKIIFKFALDELASAIIVAHNHPSGNMTASQSDIDLTRKLREAGKVLEIQVLDHLIVCGSKYLSFADAGML